MKLASIFEIKRDDDFSKLMLKDLLYENESDFKANDKLGFLKSELKTEDYSKKHNLVLKNGSSDPIKYYFLKLKKQFTAKTIYEYRGFTNIPARKSTIGMQKEFEYPNGKFRGFGTDGRFVYYELADAVVFNRG